MLRKSHRKFFYGFAVALSLIIGPTVARACSYAVDPGNPDFDPFAERNYYGAYFFFATWILIFANIGLLYFARKRYFLGIIALVFSIALQLFFLLLSMFANSCGDTYHTFIRIETVVLLLLFVAQALILVRNRGRA